MSLWSRLFPPSIAITLVRASGAGIGFVTQVLLARLLTPHDLGIFYFVSSTAMVGALLVGHGYPNLLTRFVSRYSERQKPGHLSAFLRFSLRETVMWALGGTLLLALAGWLAPNIDMDTRWAFLFGVLTIIPTSLQTFHGSLAVSYRMFVSGYFPILVLRPLLFIVPLAGFALAGMQPTVTGLSALQFASFVVVAAASFYIVRNIHLGPAEPSYDVRLTRRWRSESWPLVIVASFALLMNDVAVILATPFLPMAEVAQFGLCMKIAFLIGFTVQVAHQVLAPDMGAAIARREGHTLSAKITAASLAPLVLTAGGIAFSLLLGDHFLALFGEEFRSAQPTLTILMVSQFMRALAGPGPLLLTLKGAQTANAAICAASAVVLLLGNVLLAPRWGSEGAAVALVIATVFWLVATGIVLHRIDGVRADLAGILFRRRAD